MRLGLNHPDLVERPFSFRLPALRQVVENISGVVHPAALAAGLRLHFLDGLPKAKSAVGDGEFGRDGKPVPLQVEVSRNAK